MKNNYKILFIITLISVFIVSVSFSVKIEKQLIFDKYTLSDFYKYGKIERKFQWDKISNNLDSITNFINRNVIFGILVNYKNFKGAAPVVPNYSLDEYGVVQDKYGIPKNQSIPLYSLNNKINPVRYSRDGSFVAILGKEDNFYIIEHPYIGGKWLVPLKYLSAITSMKFDKTIFIDRRNQNIASMQLVDSVWLVRSMNPVSTGKHKPPFQRETPLGIFVLQNKLPKMVFYIDGTSEIGGYSPYASRFCCGAYIHGVPVNLPSVEPIEYINSLGTTPRSHACVRNATSHAKFIYEWAEIGKTLIFVIE